MLKRFFEAKSFIFHIPKPIQVPKLTYFGYFCISCMYTHHVCMLCVYSMHLFYVCILSMYSMHVFYTFLFTPPYPPNPPPARAGGGLIMRALNRLRIQGRMQIFEKMPQKALNRILGLPNYSTGPGLLISSGIIDLQNNNVCE